MARVTLKQYFTRGEADEVSSALRRRGFDSDVSGDAGSFRVSVPESELERAFKAVDNMALLGIESAYDPAFDAELPIMPTWLWLIPAIVATWVLAAVVDTETITAPGLAYAVIAWVIGSALYAALHKRIRVWYHPRKRERRSGRPPSSW